MKRRFAVKTGDRERIVELDDGVVRVDGRDVDVSVTQVSPGVWSLRQGNEQTIAEVDGQGGTTAKLTVEIKRPGRDAVVVATEVADARRASIVAPARPAAGGAPVVVRSPIPGRVVKLLVKAGDAVSAAQTLAYVDGENGKVTVGLKRGGDDVVVVAAEVAEARSARVAALAQRARGAAAAGPLTIRSPMPGRLVKVLVKVGDKIAAGQAVVVVEAMKMENELRAPRAGRVLDVRCTEGAAVESGQDLITVG